MSASCVLDKIKWSADDYDLREFVDQFGDCLPILCQTTSGYAGCDDDIHQVAADEIYWISSIQRQTRIVGKDTKKRFISISVDDCPFKFQVIEENDKKGSIVTSADLFTSFRQNPSNRIRFQFEKDHVVSYQLGADSGYETRFGIMELKEYYEEKYLLGYGMNNGFLYVRTIGIPVYMDVSLSRAMGFESETDEGMTFRRWTDELKKLVDLQEKPSIKIANAIIVFLERPTDGDYECVHASKLIHDNHNSKKQPDNNNTTQTDNKTENEYAYIRFLEPSTTEPDLGTTSYYNTGRFLEPTTTTEPEMETTSSINTGRDTERRRSRMEEIIRVPLPQIPRRPPPVPSELAVTTPPHERPPAPLPTARAPIPTAGVNDDRPPAIPSRKHPSWPKTKEQKRSRPLSSENHPIYQEGRSYKEGDPPRIPPNPPPPTHQPLSYELTIPGKFPTESYTSLVNLNSDHPSKIYPTECSTPDPSEMDSPEIYDTSGFLSRNRIEDDDSPTFDDDSPPPIPPLPLKWTRPVAKTTNVAAAAEATPDDVTIGVSRMASYVTASEVPRDEDVENWTVSDVTEALRLLKMSKHEDQFKEREIDGALLCSLDERTLVEDFGFKLFEATKVFMFARKGWRPK